MIFLINKETVMKNITRKEYLKAKANREKNPEDETGTGGFWDLAFTKTKIIFGQNDEKDWQELAEDIYNKLTRLDINKNDKGIN